MLNDLDINKIRDLDDALDTIRKLFNIVEALNQENLELKKQNQQLQRIFHLKKHAVSSLTICFKRASSLFNEFFSSVHLHILTGDSIRQSYAIPLKK